MIIRKPFFTDEDLQLDIAYYAAKDGEVFSLSLRGISVNSQSDKYIVYTKGAVIMRDVNDNVIVTRTAGETTDSSVFDVEAGTYFFETDGDLSEFYSTTKRDQSKVTRVEHRVAAEDELVFDKQTLVFLAIGSALNESGDEMTGPSCFYVTEGHAVNALTDCLIVELS